MRGIGLRELGGAPGVPYYARVASTRHASLIAYYPLREASGTVATDWSGNARNGTYSGVTLAQAGIGDVLTAAAFDGSTSYCNIYSAGLASAFSGAEGTLSAWAKVSGAGVWTDSTARYVVRLYVDADNVIYIGRSATNNRLIWDTYAGSTRKYVVLDGQSTTGWLHMALSWSKSGDTVKAYVSGAQTGTTQTGVGTWAGALGTTTTCIGAGNTTPNNSWSGTIAHVALWSVPLTDGEILALSRV